MRKITAIALSATLTAVVALVSATIHPQAVSAGAADSNFDPKRLTGIWRSTGVLGHPGPRPEIISIQADGHVVIDGAGHILVGTYRAEFSQNWAGALVILVEDSDLHDVIAKTVRLGLKVDTGYSVLGSRFENDEPFELDRLWHRAGAKN